MEKPTPPWGKSTFSVAEKKHPEKLWLRRPKTGTNRTSSGKQLANPKLRPENTLAIHRCTDLSKTERRTTKCNQNKKG